MTARKTTDARKTTTAARAATVAEAAAMVKNPLSLEEKLARQTLPEKTVELYLDARGVAEVEELEQQLAALTDGEKQSRMGGDPEARRIAQAITDRQDLMAESLTTFTLRALPRRQWKELVDKYPPRKVVLPAPGQNGQPQVGIHDDDQGFGINSSTFFDEVVRRSIVEPVMDDATFERVTDGLTFVQWEKLATAAWRLNRYDVSVPFSSRASLTLLGSAKK